MSADVDVRQALRSLGTDVVPFADADPGEWDALVDRSDEGWLYQRRAWIDWAGTFTRRNWSFGLADASGRLVGVLPLYEEDLHVNRFMRVRRLRSGVSGPVTSAELPAGQRQALWQRLVGTADVVARHARAAVLQVQCAMSAPAYWPGSADVRSLRECGMTMPVSNDPFHPTPLLDRFIDVRAKDDELLADMHQNARSAVRQSMRSGLTLEDAESAEAVDRYHALHVASWTRTGLTPHPREYFATMWSIHRPIGAVRILFARHDDRDVAAVLLLTYKRAAFYWGACSLAESQRLRPNNFLIWEAMRVLRESGMYWLELGVFESGRATTKSGSVGRFKASFGSTAVVPIEGQRIYRPAPFFLAASMREFRRGLATLGKRARGRLA